jgi:hypothetical protein
MTLKPGEFEWSQPEAFRRLYQLANPLIGDGQAIGTLRFEKLGGSLATAEFGADCWTLKRTGFLSPRILIRQAGSEQDFAVFTPTWTGGGWLVFASGRRYQLRSKNFWATEWAFEAEDGTPAVVLTGPSGFLKHGGHATVTEFGASFPEAPLLLLLIWYLRVLMSEDAVVVAATSG